MKTFKGIFDLLLTHGPFRGYMQELDVKAEDDSTVTVCTGMAYFYERETIYCNSEPLLLDVPDGRSLVTVRLDRKKQETWVRVAPSGWRWVLERVHNWFTRRYIYVYLAEVECRDGNVVDVQDTRQFAEYSNGGRMNILVLGAGGFAREATGIAADLGMGVAAYVVDVPTDEDILLGKPVIGLDMVVVSVPVVCGIAVRERWRILDKVFDIGSYRKLALVHPSASVDASVNVGPLSVVNRCAAIGWGAVLTKGVLVNRGASVGHDCFLNDYCSLGPGAHLAGGVRVGMKAFVGMGAVVREGVRIGAGATVGMGAVVLKDVPAGETWWGVPARKIPVFEGLERAINLE